MKSRVLKKLESAYECANSPDYIPSSPFSIEIKTVLFSSHLTFKYILLNALASKSACQDINTLCLQKQSLLVGAYDARSICHEVLVPFERKYLANALGGSNEPFLNKPARYAELTKENPCRKGNDTKLLHMLCDFLPKITTSTIAYQALIDALYYTIQLGNNKAKKLNIVPNTNASLINIEHFINSLVEESFGGESLVLAMGTLIKLYTNILDGNCKVEVHVVNQCGASSKEVSDIDVYRNNKLLYTLELKDKNFAPQDVQHAVSKALDAGIHRLFFVTGPHAQLLSSSYENLVTEAAKEGLYLTFLNYRAFTKLLLSLMLPPSCDEFIDTLKVVASDARLKDSTIEHFLQVAYATNLITK